MVKKIALLALVLALVVPQVTLAAWWNPLTWFDNWTFSKPAKEEQVQVLESRIKELERKLNNEEIVAPSRATTTVENEAGAVIPAQSTKPTKQVATTPAQNLQTGENFNKALQGAATQIVLPFNGLRRYIEGLIPIVDNRINLLTGLINRTEATMSLETDSATRALHQAFLNAYRADKGYAIVIKDILTSNLEQTNKAIDFLTSYTYQLNTLFIDRNKLVLELDAASKMSKAGEESLNFVKKSYTEFKEDADKSDAFYLETWNRLSQHYGSQLNKYDYVPPSVYTPSINTPRFTNCSVSGYGGSGTISCLSF